MHQQCWINYLLDGISYSSELGAHPAGQRPVEDTCLHGLLKLFSKKSMSPAHVQLNIILLS